MTELDSLQNKNLNGSLYAVLQKDITFTLLPVARLSNYVMLLQEESELLDVPRGSALVLIVDQVYDSTGKPLHISKLVVRGDKFKYTLK